MTAFDMPKSGAWEQRGGWVVRRLMADLHMLDYEAAGIVGNLGFESGGFATLQEIAPVAGGRGGWGWGQWTASRRLAFERWATDNHLPLASDEANYGYLLYELQGDYRSTVTALLRTKTLEDAVFSVGQTYERPGGTTPTHLPGYDGRLDYARRALAGAQGPQSAPSAVTPRDSIKRIQEALGVVSDGIFGPRSKAALNALLQAAGQPGI